MKQIPLKLLFIIALAIGIVIYILLAIITKGQTFVLSLVTVPNDIFMDLFNSAYDAQKSYSDSQVIYPPFIRMIYMIAGMTMIPFANDPLSARTTAMGGMVLAFFITISVFLTYKLINTTYNDKHKDLFALLIILSLPFINCMERGNIVIIAALLLFPFVYWYDSEDKRKRYFAYVCLAISANIKLYPVIFCLLIIREKRYKEFVHFIIIGLLLFFIPLMMMQDSLIDYINNLCRTIEFNFTIDIGITGFVKWFSIPFNISIENTKTIAYVIIMCVIIAIIWISWRIKYIEKWKLIALISLTLCTCGSFNYLYCLTYMFLPLIMFLNTNPNYNAKNITYVVCFILMMTPIIGLELNLTCFGINITQPSLLINSVVPTIMLGIIMIDIIYEHFNTSKQIKCE